MNRLFKVLIMNLILAICAANGEEAKPLKVKQPQRGRRIASIQETNQNSYRSTRGYNKNDGGFEARAGVALGAGLQKDTSSFGGVPDSQSYGAAPTVGISLDAKYARYFGLEEDAYFQLAGSTPDLGGAKDSLQSLGSYTTLKGQVPFYLGNIRLSPKAGVGFAYIKQTSNSSSATSTLDSSVTASGVYGMVGLDIEPADRFIISGDYSKSLAADVKIKNGTLEDSADTASFDRIRVSALYRFAPKIHGGVQFLPRGVQQSLHSLTAGSTQDSATQLRQIQAVFQYDLYGFYFPIQPPERAAPAREPPSFFFSATRPPSRLPP